MPAFARQEDAYFANDRPEMLAELPRPLGRVLDVGCGSGGVGAALRAAGATRVVGIEPDAAAAALAREKVDAVHTGTAEEAIGRIDEQFDLFCLYDVLEHTVDPSLVLARLKPLAAPGARFHISVPNARHFSLFVDLFVRGTFGYTDWGHRDRTHLRWFARADLEALVREQGLAIEAVNPSLPGRTALADRLTFGRLRGFFALQWHVLARVP